MEKRHRIFIAINLPEDIRRELVKIQEKFPEALGKPTSKDNLHITLVFLGDLTGVELGDVCQIAKEVAKKHEGFSVNLKQIAFGPVKKQPPKFIWALGEESKELADLKQNLENSLLEKVAFAPEGRVFSPHITLSRISAWAWKGIEPEERPEINQEINLPFDVESIEVMESELKRGGPVYTILESCELK